MTKKFFYAHLLLNIVLSVLSILRIGIELEWLSVVAIIVYYVLFTFSMIGYYKNNFSYIIDLLLLFSFVILIFNIWFIFPAIATMILQIRKYKKIKKCIFPCLIAVLFILISVGSVFTEIKYPHKTISPTEADTYIYYDDTSYMSTDTGYEKVEKNFLGAFSIVKKEMYIAFTPYDITFQYPHKLRKIWYFYMNCIKL